MSIVRVELVHRVVAQINDVALVTTKTPTGVEIYMSGGNYQGDSIILSDELFKSLIAQYNDMVSPAPNFGIGGNEKTAGTSGESKNTTFTYSGRNEPAVAVPKKTVTSSAAAALRTAEPESKGNNVVPRGEKGSIKKGSGWKKENSKIEANSCARWTNKDFDTAAEILSRGGSWVEAAEAVERTPKAVNLKAYLGQLPGVKYEEVCKTAGPLNTVNIKKKPGHATQAHT